MGWVYLWTNPSMIGPLGDALRKARESLLRDSDRSDFDSEEARRHLLRYNGKQETLAVPFTCSMLKTVDQDGVARITRSSAGGPLTMILKKNDKYYVKLNPGHKGSHWGRINDIADIRDSPFEGSLEAVFAKAEGDRLFFRLTGFLRIAGWMQNKHGDFLFVNTQQPRPVIPIPAEMERAYSDANMRNPLGMNALRPGQTVWYQTGRRFGFGPDKLQVGYAQIFPFVAPSTLLEKIPESHRPCTGPNLCPCCRIFGVAGDRSLAGCIRFSDASFRGLSDLREIPLKELSTPKASCDLFYLQPEKTPGRPLKPDPQNLRRLNNYLGAFDYGNKKTWHEDENFISTMESISRRSRLRTVR